MPYPINQRAHQFNSIQSVPVSFGLWDTALKFLSPDPRSDVTDHLVNMLSLLPTSHRKGKRDGAVELALASHQCGPGSNSGVDAKCGLSLLLVLSFDPRGFSPQKPTLPNSNSTRNKIDEEPLFGCTTSKLLFILFIISITK